MTPNNASNILDTLIQATRHRLPDLERMLAETTPVDGCRTPFGDAIGTSSMHIIAEVKLASPSRGRIASQRDPVEVARSYAAHGASAISFLTEPRFFNGDMHAFRAARRACPEVPFLMKDFFIHPLQLELAARLGADCVLLIVAALTQEELSDMIARAHHLGLAALVEVHNQEEMSIALDLKAPIIGINNRNLKTLEVNPATSKELAPMCRNRDVTLVAESGIVSRRHLDELTACGIHAFLVGSSLMAQKDPGTALKNLIDGENPDA